MNFYIRQSFESPAEGPFPPAEIIDRIEKGEITLDWLANPDLREPRSEIERSLECDWVLLRSIHDISGRWVTEAVVQTANEDTDPNKTSGCFRAVAITFVVIISILVILLGLIYAGCHGQRIN